MDAKQPPKKVKKNMKSSEGGDMQLIKAYSQSGGNDDMWASGKVSTMSSKTPTIVFSENLYTEDICAKNVVDSLPNQLGHREYGLQWIIIMKS